MTIEKCQPQLTIQQVQKPLNIPALIIRLKKESFFYYDNENNNDDPDIDIIIPEIEVPNSYATLRTDTEQVLGVVGKDYEVVQNIDAFSFFDSIIGGEGIMYEPAGALGKGERIFITAKLPDYIKVGNDDLIEKYLCLQ